MSRPDGCRPGPFDKLRVSGLEVVSARGEPVEPQFSGARADFEKALAAGFGCCPGRPVLAALYSQIHRRRNANVIKMKLTGTIPATQSQCTLRPKRGLMVALATMDIATIMAAVARENGQVLRAGCCPFFAAPRFPLVSLAIRNHPFPCRGNTPSCSHSPNYDVRCTCVQWDSDRGSE